MNQFRWRNMVGLLIFAFGYGTTVPLTDWFGGAEMKSFADYAELPLIGALILAPVAYWMDKRERR